MAAPNPDESDPIASTFQFRAFALRGEVGEKPTSARRGLLMLAALFAALVLAVVLVWLIV